MPLGLLMGIGRAFRRKRTSSLDILSSKRAPRNYYKGKNCKPTGFHTRKGGYVLMQEKLPNYVVPDLTDFKYCTGFSSFLFPVPICKFAIPTCSFQIFRCLVQLSNGAPPLKMSYLLYENHSADADISLVD
ncbi:39S ribosomal protein L41-A mitochondrial [Tripterygium wilfordii]|uniref:39S ribosomal protein L41-A mitochondrial n=1 Tax=Tripterygium wilfordii TaxID=458696 RepID=A0A7J7DKF4_TRIWF|nr:39S ribosomal protein L41-A, mitochondrial-like isoform X1 [Tripterygium wilfordii]KAF5746788.1 39S ribosomal protein L41-A mitochondrial [Tripterygium wilfordii]